MPTLFEEKIQAGEITWTFGEILRKLRKDAGVSPATLAKKLRTTPSAVSQWENNKHRPKDSDVETIADFLGQPIEVFPDKQGMPMSRCTGHGADETLVSIYRARRKRNRTPSTKPFQPRLVR